jgi:two-component system CheB/CheR fusion protein
VEVRLAETKPSFKAVALAMERPRVGKGARQGRAQEEDPPGWAKSIFDEVGEAIVVTDADGQIIMVNTSFSLATGYSAQEVVGRNVSLLQSGRHDRPFYENMWNALFDKGLWQGEIWDKHKDGEIHPKRMTIKRVEHAEGQTTHYVAVFVDISSLIKAKECSEYLATRDALTGLANRILFHDHLNQALAEARRAETQIALFYIDLDNFKAINDALGHHVGDSVLVETARRLNRSVRESDTVARLGGDEFSAILLNCNAELAEQISRRIMVELALPISIEGHGHTVSASIGIAFYPGDGLDGPTLLRCADSALYRRVNACTNHRST